MKLQLLYQKVYFKSNEWKEVVNFIKLLTTDVSVFLLSKNIFLQELKQVKNQFLGECVIIELHFSDINIVFDVISKIQNKYSSKLFLIGFLLNENKKIYFLKLEQFKYYLNFFNNKSKKEVNLVSIQSLILYEFLKYLKLNEVSSSICLSFLKSNNLNNFSFYY